MHLFSVRWTLLVCSLSFFTLSFGQLSSYFENGESAARQQISSIDGGPGVTQITYFPYDFVEPRVHNALDETNALVPFEEYRITKQGEFEIYKRKYKSRYNDELVPQRRYLEVEYKTAVVEGIRIILSAKFSGLESYVGEFYGGFYIPKIDAKYTESGEVMSHTFMQDKASVQTKKDPKSRDQLVWLEVNNTVIKDFNKFKAALTKKITDDRNARIAFEKRRTSTVFSLKDVNSKEYTSLQQSIDEAVKRSMKNTNGDLQSNFEVIVKVDTTGKSTVDFSSSNPLAESIKSSLSYLNIDEYKENGKYMFTEDRFSYNVSRKAEKGQVFLKKDQITFKTTNTQEYQTAVQNEKAMLSSGRGIYDVTVTSASINSTPSTMVNIDTFKSKKSPLAYAVGGLVILGGAAYYGLVLLVK
jgi:hypothetical protein